jgi:protein-S-isoprenylcysteine O-methyltransferase Ste14
VSSRRIDLIERMVVVLSCVASTALIVPGLADGVVIGNVLVLVANVSVAAFVIVRRRPTEISLRTSDWIIGILGTAVPLLNVPATGPQLAPPTVGATLALAGIVISLVAKLSLRRSFSIVPARGRIVERGPYRFVRHPMYTGYFITHVGILLYGFRPWNLACYLTCWALLWVRISREEALLTKDASYRTYCTQVRYRVLWGVI